MKSLKFYSTLKLVVIGLLCITSVKSYSASNYNITFTASGASTSVGSVIVENITQGTKVTVPAGNSLMLSDGLSALQQVGSDNNQLICKTDMQGITTVSFEAKQSGLVQINAYGMDGRKITSMSNKILAGQCSYKLILPKGLYVLQVQGVLYKYSSKICIQKSAVNAAQISFLGTERADSSGYSKVKSSTAGVTQMLYDDGDQLVLKGYSGNYATYVPVLPVKDTLINFNFVECSDADGNHYATVKIGGQLWMAENLKTTKFRDGSLIPIVPPSSTLTKVSCYYAEKDAATKDSLGLLYTWFAQDPESNGFKELSPIGWHTPTYAELETLQTHVGQYNMWDQMRTTDWLTANAEGCTNSTGFSARQTGYLYAPNGGYGSEFTSFWSSDLGVNSSPYALVFHSQAPDLHLISYGQSEFLLAIRCIHD